MSDNPPPDVSMASDPPADMDGMRRAFFQAFGEAMSAFGGIEVGLMALFRTLLRPEDPKCADDLFNSVIGFNVRVGMVTTLVKSSQINNDIRESWNAVAKEIAAAQKKRNSIAHMHVREMTGKDLFGHDPATDFASLPLSWAERKNHVQTTQKLKTQEEEFYAVARTVFQFTDRIRLALRADEKTQGTVHEL
jgi:hypothetical protein